ncbi:MAG: hypothetical protein MI717_09750 [Spirochaetales bacterium]|nr:hypothetical protein [Spirochaetales bacterium]
MPISIPKSLEEIDGYEGFEAITFDGDEVYLTIEVDRPNKMLAYIVKGMVTPNGIVVSPKALRVDVPEQYDNMGLEGLTMYDRKLLALFEVNNEQLPSASSAYLCPKSFEECTPISMQNLEYRVTGLTRPSRSGEIWAINMVVEYYSDMLKSNRKNNPCNEISGAIKNYPTLVPLNICTEGVFRDMTYPVLCVKPHPAMGDQPNFEGLVRLDDKGFLIITDQYPTTVFGFVRGVE